MLFIQEKKMYLLVYTKEQILQIRELYKVGHRNINVIARNYKVSPANIKKIVTNETWKHMVKWPYESTR